MYEIKSIYGKVLYVAKDATDVRTALEEAAKNGAYLRGAYLNGANLDGANLHGAYLRGAYLNGAYLNGAYLRGAYLNGAYLNGANLDGANLHGANLDGANLHGANLDGANLNGANLDGAYLDGKVWTQVASALTVSLNAMNDGGRHWIKGALQKYLEDGSSAYCSIGSIEANSKGTIRALAKWLLSSVCAGAIELFNDFENTTWEDVQAVFTVAIKHAERFAKQNSA